MRSRWRVGLKRTLRGLIKKKRKLYEDWRAKNPDVHPVDCTDAEFEIYNAEVLEPQAKILDAMAEAKSSLGKMTVAKLKSFLKEDGFKPTRTKKAEIINEYFEFVGGWAASDDSDEEE